MLDTVLGCAVQTTLDAGEAYTTLLARGEDAARPLIRETGQVLAEGSIVYRGRRQATAEARLLATGSGKLLATGTSTCMVFAA